MRLKVNVRRRCQNIRRSDDFWHIKTPFFLGWPLRLWFPQKIWPLMKSLPFFCFMGLDAARTEVCWIEFFIHPPPFVCVRATKNLCHPICHKDVRVLSVYQLYLLQRWFRVRPVIDFCVLTQNLCHKLSHFHADCVGSCLKPWNASMMRRL